MCGIAGILRLLPAGTAHPPPHLSIPEPWLDRLDAAIRHRGPDGQGRFRQRALLRSGAILDVALVHRRLAIIDPAGGAQPMLTRGAGTPTPAQLFLGAPGANTDYSPAAHDAPVDATVFNGCIYNHRDLRRELAALGVQFRSHHSDAEVIAPSLRAWGVQAPVRLDGMFAAAVWSAADARLTLLRDLAGEKPLYVLRSSPTLIAFASTCSALISLGGLLPASQADAAPLRPDPAGVADWLRFGASLRPFFQAIREVAPRSMWQFTPASGDRELLLDAGAFRLLPGRRTESGELTPAQAHHLIADAVRSRLDADVPLGVFLSGGIDSSLVALHARQSLGSLRTFTVRMPDPRFDESAPAQRVASLLGTDHATLDCDPRPADHLRELIPQVGLPFVDSSLLPTHWVARAARGHVSVALAGDGGDELFAGYERHVAARILHRWGPLLRNLPIAESACHPKSRRAKLRRLVLAARGGYQELLAIFPHADLLRLCPGIRVDRPATTPVPDAPRHDFEHYLPADLLRKADSASMAVPIELRAPLLAPAIVDAALAAPLTDLMPRGRRKGLLKAVARASLPADVVDRPKMGFAIPVGRWFREDFGALRTTLEDALASADPFPSSLLGLEVSLPAARTMLDDHLAQRRDHSQRLYALLVLALWSGWARSALRP